jgi:predicted metal-dependent phosphoesterase TrpH
MALLFDFHLHTRRYSADSTLDPKKLIGRAVRAGLDGVVITEHHHIWDPSELEELVADGPAPGFILLSGFEYTSTAGDILIYGLVPDQCAAFVPGKLTPDQAVDRARSLGAACVAAHPTRQGLGFDETIFTLPLQGMEVASCNLTDNEQRLAGKLAHDLSVPATASSDAHRIDDVGRYATLFTGGVRTIAEFSRALKCGQFRYG